MQAKYIWIGSFILGGTVCLGTAALIAIALFSEPQCAWNDGANEKIAYALKAICFDLYFKDKSSGGCDPEDFIPRCLENNNVSSARSGKSLADKYGVSVRWRRNGVYEKLFFYPVALSNNVTINPKLHSAPTPQMAMVPVDEEDIETLPNLSGCKGIAANRIWERQFLRMMELFYKHELKYAFTLRSDGSVYALPVDDLTLYVDGPGRTKK